MSYTIRIQALFWKIRPIVSLFENRSHDSHGSYRAVRTGYICHTQHIIMLPTIGINDSITIILLLPQIMGPFCVYYRVWTDESPV